MAQRNRRTKSRDRNGRSRQGKQDRPVADPDKASEQGFKEFAELMAKQSNNNKRSARKGKPAGRTGKKKGSFKEATKSLDRFFDRKRAGLASAETEKKEKKRKSRIASRLKN